MKATAAAAVEAIALAHLSLPARAQRDDARWRAMPEANPLVDGVLVRPVEFPVARGGDRAGNDVLRQLVMFDFRPAFPPYKEKSLAELLLVPKPKAKESEIAATSASEERKPPAAETSTEVEDERTETEDKPLDGYGDGESASQNESIDAESPSSKGSDERLPDSGDGDVTTNGKRPQDHGVGSEANEDAEHDADVVEDKPPAPSEDELTNIEDSQPADEAPSKDEHMRQQQGNGNGERNDDSIDTKGPLVLDRTRIDLEEARVDEDGDVGTPASAPLSKSTIEGLGYSMEKEVAIDVTRRDEGTVAEEQLNGEPNVAGPAQLSSNESAESVMEAEDDLSESHREESENGLQPGGDGEIEANAEEAADAPPPKVDEGAAEMAPETAMAEDDLEEVVSARTGADMQNVTDPNDTATAHAAEAHSPDMEAPKAEASKADDPKAEEADATKAEAPKADAPKAEAPKADDPKADEKADVPGPDIGSKPDDTPAVERISIENNDATNSKRMVDDIKPTVPAGNNKDANRLFVDGLDEIDKLFESVDVPDELDPGADGSSMQDVLVGQGLKIAWKRAKHFGRSMKGKFEDIAGNIKKALPLGILDDEGEDDEGKTAFDAFLRDKDLTRNSLVPDEKESGGQKDGAEKEEALEDGKNRRLKDKHKLFGKMMKEKAARPKKEKDEKKNFPLVTMPQAQRIWKFAMRKWKQAKHLLDDLLNIFEGTDDDEFGLNLEDIRKDMGVLGKRADTLKKLDGKFGSDVDESFLRSRYEEMLKQQQQKKEE